MSKIKVDHLTLIFGKQKEQALQLAEQGKSKADILAETGCTLAVNEASFEIEEGEVFVIMGLSGSGKSTLLRCLNRLINPTAGKVIFNGADITQLSNKELLQTRRKGMSMVFQRFGLMPNRTVLSNVAFGLELQGMNKKDREAQAMKSIESVGLKNCENMYPSELSGGMQQRVGLARALATNSEVLLMDEAFSALDPLIKADMQDELLQLQQKLKKTVVFITHDLDEAIKLGDRIAIMKDGSIDQIGTAEEILTKPATEYVRAFVEKVDRKTIITAKTLMFEKPTVVQFKKDGPEGTIRKMREIGVEQLPVVDENRKFLGFVGLADVLNLKKSKEQTIEKALETDALSVPESYTVEEMLPLISENRTSLAVIDEDKTLKGIVSQSSIIAEATRFEEEEISSLQHEAKEVGWKNT